MTFYARLYSNFGSLTLHTSDYPITGFIMEPSGLDVYELEFEGEFIPSNTLLANLSINEGSVVSAGPSILSQELL